MLEQKYSLADLAQAADALPVDSASGLSQSQAQQLLAKVGPNQPGATARRSGLAQLLISFATPLVVILLLASAVLAFVGETFNAVIIALMVLVSVGVNFLQTFRSERAADALPTQVAPTATVLRDAVWKAILRREVMPGDVVRLAAGDLVPADARLLNARDLQRDAGGGKLDLTITPTTAMTFYLAGGRGGDVAASLYPLGRNARLGYIDVTKRF